MQPNVRGVVVYIREVFLLIILTGLLLGGCVSSSGSMVAYATSPGIGELTELFHLPFGDGPGAVGFLPFRDEWVDQGPMSFEVIGKEVFILDTANRRIIVRPLPDGLLETQVSSDLVSSSKKSASQDKREVSSESKSVSRTIDLPGACWLKDSAVETVDGRVRLLVYDLCTETVTAINPSTDAIIDQQAMHAPDWEAMKQIKSPFSIRRASYDTYTFQYGGKTVTIRGRQGIERLEVLDVWSTPDPSLIVYKIEQSGSETIIDYKHSVGLLSPTGSIEAAYVLPMRRDIYIPYSPVRARDGYIYWMSVEKDGLYFYRVIPGIGSKDQF